MPKNWLPLESNPDVMNDYVGRLGLDLTKIAFHDVLSIDDWALDMVPKPVLGVLMLFPIKKITEDYRAEELKRIESEGQICSDKVYYMKQTVGNACGTVGILHAIGNARSVLNNEGENGSIRINPKSYLEGFFNATDKMNPDEIAEYLGNDEEVGEIHSSAAVEGQSDAIPEDEDVDTHFVCFSHIDGYLYELDGRKQSPINHGITSPNNLLKDATIVIKKFMERDPEELRFTIVALAAASSEE